MEQDRSSLTAQRVAMARAAHQILDSPRVFEDPIAIRISGEQKTSEISSAPDPYRTSFATYLRAFLVARSKYAEDALADAIRRGCKAAAPRFQPVYFARDHSAYRACERPIEAQRLSETEIAQ